MSFKINRSHSSTQAHALKSALIFIGVAVVLTGLIVPIAIEHEKQAQEAARQAQIHKEADEQAAAEKAALAQKNKADYEKCIQDANSIYSEYLAKVPTELYGTARIEYIQTLQSTTESFKNDCDRRYEQ